MARRLLYAFAGTALAIALVPATSHADVTPLFGFLPAIGKSVAYRYDANESGPSESGNVRTIVTFTRVAEDELTLRLSPEKPPLTVMITSDGSLQPFAQHVLGATGTPSPTPAPSPRLKRGQLAPFVTPTPRATPHRTTIPDPLSEVASMLSVASAAGDFPRIWTYVRGDDGPEFRLSVSRSDSGATTMFVADGGTISNSLHVEVTTVNGKFAGARGTLKVAAMESQYPQTTTIWSLTPQ